MSRAKKLLIVSFVLAIGIGLALPFRRQPGESQYAPTADGPPQTSAFNGPAQPFDRAASETSPARGKIARQVEAHMASTREQDSTTGFDLKSHPALAGRPAAVSSEKPTTQPDAAEASPVTPQTLPSTGRSRPAYATSLPEIDEAAWPEEVVHVVHNGDTLEKLAERYLGDPGRAMELFDLNREQLSNPHLLPIGAELRIPVPARREND